MSLRLLRDWLAVLVGMALAFFGLWVLAEHTLPDSNPFLVYFGSPIDVVEYGGNNWASLLRSAGLCALTAVVSLILSGVLAILLLIVGLGREGWLARIEGLAAVTQTVPTIIVVVLVLIVERWLFTFFQLDPPVAAFCIAPVTLALIFPPLVYGAHAIVRLPLELKGLLRMWSVSRRQRILVVYIPSALPSVLAGVRTSATWAVSATLITEGMLQGVSPNSRALGQYLLQAFSSSAPPGRTVAASLVAVVLGYAVYCLARFVENYIEGKYFGHGAVEARSFSLVQR